ncbi:hypothetical protein D9758_004892 [Tetrapyrgos nigripes]|uniref:ferric-chelate reductase (NADPH) n=1 Tax=Tetrapyrgos nigripes TaxID=182062 RepID=A0A8H5G604_9AGAR|nr:hypothetical protein D9758_004892 [Tetrapyrgos nigripes]
MAREWLSMPIQWLHGPRAPNPNSTSLHISELSEQERNLLLSKFHYYYTSDWDWGLPTIEFFCAGIGLIIVCSAIFRIRGRRARTMRSNSVTHAVPGLLDRLTAAARYTVAQQYRVPLFGWYSPPLGAIIVIAGIFTFLMGFMLSVRPYYWSNPLMGHSPPIATRTGWISLGIMPFMFAFSTKVNWVGLLTETSHEKLQVFHRWTALFMYITSLVHTFPFIVARIRDGTMEVNWRTGNFYWTGVAALVPQTWLIFMSWGIVRNRYYEFFKKMHMIAGVLFMMFLFVHVNGQLYSWDYFLATFAIYFSAFFIRNLKTLYNGFALPASLQTLPDGMLKLNVTTPARVKWAPGQHFIIRFLHLGIHAFSSHPFTVASIASRDGEQSDLELVFAAQGGITKRLKDVVAGKPSKAFKVWIDGPYGGPPVSVSQYDRVYLMAGGSGVAFTLALLRDLTQRARKGELKCTHVEFILAVKKSETLLWMEDEFAGARAHGIAIQLHVTQPGHDIKREKSVDVEDDSIDDKSMEKPIAYGRPNLPAIVYQVCRTQQGTIAIAACGPASFLYDLRNAVADCQLAIADGYGRCKDLYLHTETFSW